MIEDSEILEGQRNIFEVIADFENIPDKPKRKITRKREIPNNGLPIVMKTEDFLRMRCEKND